MIALVADRVSRPGRAKPGAGIGADISGYVTPSLVDTTRSRFQVPPGVDPFDNRRSAPDLGVASATPAPTVPSSSRRNGLTAILIADERRVAVIDDSTVAVGDVLRDGSRVSSIEADRVFVEKSGRLRMLTLAIGGGR
jgi:hypothetical protein